MEDIILPSYTLKYSREDPNDIFSEEHRRCYQPDTLSLFRIPDPNISYTCSEDRKSKGFDYIHKIVLKIRRHPEALDILKEYLETFPEKINCQNNEGYIAH